jgi:hypothetical protein
VSDLTTERLTEIRARWEEQCGEPEESRLMWGWQVVRDLIDALAARDAEVARLRERVHEVVDETQRRYAKYQSFSDEFNATYKQAQQLFGKDFETASWYERLVASGILMRVVASEEHERVLRDALERIAAHDNDRWTWEPPGIAIPQPSPQDISPRSPRRPAARHGGARCPVS